jgi:three-Cys-motif partner protein
MCQFVEEPDGLSEVECGQWTLEKLFFLCHYLAITTRAMVGNPRFSAVNYVDLFAGAGVCRVAGTGRTRRYPGSALLAAGCPKPFDNLLLVDQNLEYITDLRERIHRLGTSSSVVTWNADVNAVIQQVSDSIPSRSLTVAFVDPYSLAVHYDTIRTLAWQRPLDLLILFADSMDIVRNVDEYYYPRKSPNLDLFLGLDSDWRQGWDSLQNRSGGNVRELFASIYLRQLESIGYRHTRMRTINSERGPLYRLIYASKNPKGLKFWDIAESYSLGGDRTFW